MIKRETDDYYLVPAPVVSDYERRMERRVPSVGTSVSDGAETGVTTDHGPHHDKDIALKTTYGSWDKHSRKLLIPRDPRNWTRGHVCHWLH